MEETPEATDATAAGQIAAMGKLKQKAAAWLLGWRSSRPLRDRTSPPQNPDGSYNGQELVAWARAELPATPPKLSEADAAKAQRLANIFVGCVECESAEVLAFISGVQRRYGTAGLASVLTAFMAELEDVAKLVTPPDRSIWDYA